MAVTPRATSRTSKWNLRLHIVMPHAARQPWSWLIFDVGCIRSYAAANMRGNLEEEGRVRRGREGRLRKTAAVCHLSRFRCAERKCAIWTLGSGTPIECSVQFEWLRCRLRLVRDVAASYFQRAQCPTPYTQQGARANDHGRHAACYRTSNRSETKESKSSCRTRRAGHGRGSSLTFGKMERG